MKTGQPRFWPPCRDDWPNDSDNPNFGKCRQREFVIFVLAVCTEELTHWHWRCAISYNIRKEIHRFYSCAFDFFIICFAVVDLVKANVGRNPSSSLLVRVFISLRRIVITDRNQVSQKTTSCQGLRENFTLDVQVQKPEKHGQGVSSYLTYEVTPAEDFFTLIPQLM